ncbi:8076_t:CDS:2, partial [Gigaspora rosea]
GQTATGLRQRETEHVKINAVTQDSCGSPNTAAPRAAISAVRINQFAMSRKQKKTMEISPLKDRTFSEETIEPSEPSGSQEQEIQSHESQLSPQTKAYLDTIIQSTAASLALSMRQYMDQQFETINRRFAQLKQANIGGDVGTSSNHSNTEQVTGMQHTQIHSQEPARTTSIGNNADQFEGNYQSTSTLNRLIIEANSGAQSNEKQGKDRIIKYK